MRRLRLTWRLLRIAALLALGGVLAVALSIRYRRLDAGNDSRRQLTRWWLARLARALPFRVTVYGEAPSGPCSGWPTMCPGRTSRCSGSWHR